MKWTLSVADILNGLLALAAFVWSVITWRKGTRLQQRLAEIEENRERDRKRDRLKADLTTRIERKKQATMRNISFMAQSCDFVIENHSMAEARCVQVFLDAKPIMSHPCFSGPNAEVGTLGGKSHFTYNLLIGYGGIPHALDVLVRWQDDSEEDGSYRTTVTL